MLTLGKVCLNYKTVKVSGYYRYHMMNSSLILIMIYHIGPMLFGQFVLIFGICMFWFIL
jgi:hypothetical protein